MVGSVQPPPMRFQGRRISGVASAEPWHPVIRRAAETKSICRQLAILVFQFGFSAFSQPAILHSVKSPHCV